MAGSALVALAIPLPSGSLPPGFGPLALFGYMPFLVPYCISLAALGFLMFRLRESRTRGLIVTVAYAVLTVSIWQIKIPDGVFLGGTYYGAITTNVLHTGHLSYVGWGTYPLIFTLASTLTQAGGISLTSALTVLDLYHSVFFAVLYFLLANRFLSSVRLAAGAATLSMIADEQLLRDPQFNVSTYGLLFFLLAIYLIYRFGSKRTGSFIALFALISCAYTITYPMTPFLIITILFFAFVGSLRFHGRVYKPKIVANHSMLAIAVAPYLAWTAYVSGYVGLGTLLFNNIRSLFFGPSASSSPAGPHGFTFYLTQLLLSNASATPFHLNYLVPLWFLVFFGLGGLIWVSMKIRRSPSAPEASVMGALVLIGVLLFLLPGGAEWFRVLPFIAPFLGVGIFSSFFLKKGGRRFMIVSIVIVLFTVPTLIAYSPQIGVDEAQYQWEFASGNYLTQHGTGNSIFIGSGIVTTDYALQSEVNAAPGLPGGTTGPVQAQTTLVLALTEFESPDRNSILSSSPLFFGLYAHLFGSNSASTARSLMALSLKRNDLVYSNGFTAFYFG